ncbi:16S rRNA (guanine(527)-N(7))-methyltransferase RsmG [Clostridium algidicarnis]|uniref:Ribosomal RNA small subunit methyltransferase G n=1 Tax=Clostridium algidicarnis TaxID=37659 RepID=A0ABS6C4Q6_9CLOT|nr:16S rRNA (guanine(527)-N(7))-methyltransferase RsmG [Clostridium algidicarnis]MBB6629913.1 16S rRNA (guanine(527)-N(7))-methyltransferase RsmG [Clostridium algidicarnis]MBU3194758.1 16S rRNA (guanine(527)-N(7))-methyltransferase RsmG [Clostridium algidicarnis]MBU3197309.1 16S rRNA (guanine(527)-N(7))-methyltransferase RsmG [Clostridium algidicarnis]MBU3204777.1 16S rRNA (guanine(527)-N(7))-methyltransferase RsmG [Clostridium algidicarnis]MBU3207567.1 16S rRNA (guanine(527)-N(7))-methyltrans
MEFYDLMKTASDDVSLDFNEEKFNKFMNYKDILKEWNNKINLTAIIEDDDIVKKHFIDCIKAFKFKGFKEAKSIIDVGTGAGFPGIPIGIMKEDCNIVLLDSLNKRVKFLDEVIEKLYLNNFSTIHGRGEELSRSEKYREKFDIATSRAVANMCTLSELCLPYVKLGGYFVALKGPSIEEELNGAKRAIAILGGKVQEIIPVNIENSDLNHNLVIIKKVSLTPSIYPRNSGIMSKKPLG